MGRAVAGDDARKPPRALVRRLDAEPSLLESEAGALLGGEKRPIRQARRSARELHFDVTFCILQ